MVLVFHVPIGHKLESQGARHYPHNHADGGDSCNLQSTSVEHTRSQYSPHAGIQTQNTTQSGDNSQSVRSHDSVNEIRLD